jgi:hypothetical protein
MPISLALAQLDPRTIGEQMQTGLTPFLDQMNDILRRRNDQLSRIGAGVLTLVTATLGTLGGLQAGVQQVQVVNLALIELMAAGSFAFLVLTFLKLSELSGQLVVVSTRLNAISDSLARLQATLNASQSCTCGLLQDVLAELRAGLTVRSEFSGQLVVASTRLNAILESLARLQATLNAFQSCTCGLLKEVLAELRAGLTVKLSGEIVVSGGATLTIESKGPTWPGDIDLWELLGLVGILSLALLALVLFVAGLGLALSTFTVDAVIALAAIALFIYMVTPLVKILGELSGLDILGVVVGLAALALFVYALGVALSKLNVEVLKQLPQLSAFVKTLQDLAKALGAMPAEDIAGMIVGLAALALFVYVLGQALNKLNADMLKNLGTLSTFIDTLKNLATALGAMPAKDVAGMIVGLAALTLFVYFLGQALGQLSEQSVKALPDLSGFISRLQELATTLAKMPAADLAGMIVGLAALALFVYGLALALNTLGADAVAALPGMSGLILVLTGLALAMAGLDPMKLFVMGAAFALIALFVYALAAAVDMATPGLQALADILGSVERMLNVAAAAAGSLAKAISGIPSLDLSLPSASSLPSFQGGGTMPYTGLAVLHQGERVLTASETQVPAPIAASGQSVDQSVNVGGITITINAERLEADAAEFLSDEIVRRLQDKLGALHSDQQFQSGTRAAPA